MKTKFICTLLLTPVIACFSVISHSATQAQPNVVLVMADDQGYGQTSYYNHPTLKTPNLDDMATNGLRFDRFYAAAPVCSPTRASVLTGRSNERTGVLTHGYALHRQERTIAQAMRKANYATGHFGKWHLNGLRGPGVPVLADDPYNPGHFGFDEWLTTTNFFDIDPLLSRKGKFEDFKGDSSEVIVDEALKFIAKQKAAGKPSFTVIWYGSPHSPWEASADDKMYPELQADNKTPKEKREIIAHHYGEMVAMDRSIGTLRAGLKKLGLSDNTLVWFNSDNGGLREQISADEVGGLRGGKGTLWEGGLRVPAIIEWPAGIQKPRVTNYPASTMDIMPTLVDLLNLPADAMLETVDGSSLRKLLNSDIAKRAKPIPFQYRQRSALIDNDYKLIRNQDAPGVYQLFDLKKDPKETENIYSLHPEKASAMKKIMGEFVESVSQSKQGADYPERRVTMEGPHFRYWHNAPEYRPFLESWSKRPEYSSWLKKMEGVTSKAPEILLEHSVRN